MFPFCYLLLESESLKLSEYISYTSLFTDMEYGMGSLAQTTIFFLLQGKLWL